uniref:Uncharacterized protein n=1 Tax=viral metagenome TaxID=1070528 RepID=A0A6M3MBM4_9ZZZZ
MSKSSQYLKEWTLEDVRELHEFLQGNMPEGFTLRAPPNLDAHMAFSIIYILQEHFKAITDEFELCESCETIFYNDYGWHFDDPGIHLCNDCLNKIVGYHISLESDEAIKRVTEWYESRKCADLRRDG